VLRASALPLALLGLVPVANLLSAGREVPWWPGALLIWTAYGALLLAVLWVVSSRWSGAVDRLLALGADAVMRVPSRWFTLVTSAWTTLAAVFVALYCYAGRGFTGDEMAMLWHARMLLAGHVAIPRPEHSEFFNSFGVVDGGPRWFSQFPIGGPALLAAGLLVKAPWLINPVLLGVAAWQLYRFARRAYGEAAARAATLLFALSPFVLVLGATQLSHTASLALTLVALAELAAWDDAAAPARTRHAVLLGLAVGAVALVRPFDAALLALPIAVVQLARVRRQPERRGTLLVQCVAGAIPIALLLLANARTTGSPLLFAYDAAHGPAHGLGFHLDPNGAMHTPRRGLMYVSGYLLRLNRFLFEWPLPALLVICAVLTGLRRATRWDGLLLGLVGAYLLGYGAYWYNGFFDGPRFLFPVVPAFVLYAARVPEVAAYIRSSTRRRVALLLVPACVLCAWLVPLTFSSVPARLRMFHGQRSKFKVDVAAQVRRAGLADAVVFVRDSWHERLLARLSALGVRPFDAERIVKTMDACALQTALDDSDRDSSSDAAARRERVLATARAAGRALRVPGGTEETRLARVPGGPDTPRCRDEMAADTLGAMPYATFLREQRVDATGRLAGPVIFARDLGARDSLLRAQLGARRWYLYRPGRSLEEPPTFVPLRAP
jgi:hypothetical protein